MFKYLDAMLQDPEASKPSVGRFGLLWSLVILTPIMLLLTALGVFPGSQIALVLGAILGAPALVQSVGYLRRGARNANDDPGTTRGN